MQHNLLLMELGGDTKVIGKHLLVNLFQQQSVDLHGKQPHTNHTNDMNEDKGGPK